MQNPLLFPEVRRGQEGTGSSLGASPRGACLAGRTAGFLCFCRVPPPPPPRPLFGSDSEKSHHPPAIRWPPVSAGTLLTDSPAQGRTERGLAFRPAGATPPLWGSPSAWLPPPPPPPWPPRSRHLGHAIPVEVGDGAPPPGPYIPQAPLFLFKGTDCNLGAGTRLPQPLAPQKARYRPSHRPRTGARAGGTVSPEARAPSPRRPLAYAMPSVGPCK